MIGIFKKKQESHPIKKYAYAIGTGTYVGEMFVFVNENDDEFEFISIPKNINRKVPKDKFNFGLENKIIEVVEQIPADIFSLLEKQFEFNRDKTK